MSRTDLLISLGIGVAMMATYVRFVAAVVTGGTLVPGSFYEWVILGTQVALGIALFVLRDWRDLDILSATILMGATALTLLGWLAVGLVTKNQLFAQLGATTLLSWIAGLAVALPPYAIFRVVRYLRNGARFSIALPSTVVMTGFLLALGPLAVPNAGVKDASVFGEAVLMSLTGRNTTSFSSGLPEIALLVTVFVGLILKVVNSAPQADAVAVTGLLGTSAIASLLVLGYDTLLGGGSLPGLLVAIPVFLIVGITWWLARGP